MVRLLIVLILILNFVGLSWAQQNRRMGPVNDPNRVTLFNKTTDFLATAGESPSDKQEILRERQAMRRKVRMSAERRKEYNQTQKKIKKERAYGSGFKVGLKS